MCRNSWAKTFGFDGKTQWQMFLSLYGIHFGILRRTPTWRLHTKLYKFWKFGWDTFPNNTWMNNRTDLNRGEVVYISIIFLTQLLNLIYWIATIFSLVAWHCNQAVVWSKPVISTILGKLPLIFADLSYDFIWNLRNFLIIFWNLPDFESCRVD